MKAIPRFLAKALLTLSLLFVYSEQLRALDLTQAVFTDVHNQVSVTDETGNVLRPAQKNDIFAVPEVIVTGPNSRAELTASDRTVTRVGSNTIFSFNSKGRGINLKQGSVLFHSPKGKGGGIIQSTSASASVLGTTIIVSATQNGGFKLLVLEGVAKLSLGNGLSQTLKAGQMAFIFPGMTQLPPIFEFRLSKLVNESKLIDGFPTELSSLPKIDDAIDQQEKKIASGNSTDTGLRLGDVNSDNQVQIIDDNARQPRLSQGANPVLFTLTGTTDTIQLGGSGVLIVGGATFNNPTANVTFGTPANPLTSPIDITSSTFTADNFSVQTQGSINLLNTTLSLTSAGDFHSFNGDVYFNNVALYASDISVFALNNIGVYNGSNFNSATNITLQTTGSVGFIDLQNGMFTANAGINVNSAGNMNISNFNFTAFGGPVNLNAATGPGGGTLGANNIIFNAPAVSMAAKTLILTNIDFGGPSTSVLLRSLTGNPSFNNISPGDICFMGPNNRYAGISITDGSSLTAAMGAGPFNLGIAP
jgi:hypothetical protein